MSWKLQSVTIFHNLYHGITIEVLAIAKVAPQMPKVMYLHSSIHIVIVKNHVISIPPCSGFSVCLHSAYQQEYINFNIYFHDYNQHFLYQTRLNGKHCSIHIEVKIASEKRLVTLYGH